MKHRDYSNYTKIIFNTHMYNGKVKVWEKIIGNNGVGMI